MSKNIEINYKGDQGYEVLYPKNLSDNIGLSDSLRTYYGLKQNDTIDDVLEQKIGASMVAVGSIYWYASETIPLGFLKCDGSQISRIDYQNLFNVIGTVFGNGDGSSTFGLPNLQAKFIRGAGQENGYVGYFGQIQEASYIYTAGQPNGLDQQIAHEDPIKNSDKEISLSTKPRAGTSMGNVKTGWASYIRPYNIALTPIIKY